MGFCAYVGWLPENRAHLCHASVADYRAADKAGEVWLCLVIAEACRTLSGSCKPPSRCLRHPGPLPKSNSFLSACPVWVSIYSPSLFIYSLSFYFPNFNMFGSHSPCKRAEARGRRAGKREERGSRGCGSGSPEAIQRVSAAPGVRADPGQSLGHML